MSNKKEDKPTIHVLMRVVSERGLTVSAHKEMVSLKGAALFGKMGRPISKDFQDTLNDQIARGVKTFFFLITREGEKRQLVAHKCELAKVYDGPLDNAKGPLVPKYYASSIPDILTWFEITSFERLPEKEIANIFTPSTGREITNALKGTGTVFRVAIRS